MSAKSYLAGQSRITLPVWAIPFACRDPNADKTLRATNLMSCLEILASLDDLSASNWRCSNTRKGGSFPWSMKFLIHESPTNCCNISFSRCRRISGPHLSTTCLCAVVLDVCLADTYCWCWSRERDRPGAPDLVVKLLGDDIYVFHAFDHLAHS